MSHWFWRAALAILAGAAAGFAFGMSISALLAAGPGVAARPGMLHLFILLDISRYVVSGTVTLATWHYLTAWCVRRRRAELLRAGQCSECGYDLTGNTSGVCPECGGAT